MADQTSWEYVILWSNGTEYPDVEIELNRLGRSGWELVWGYGVDNLKLILKRPCGTKTRGETAGERK